MEDTFYPACENVERKADKKIWYWAECLEEAKRKGLKFGTILFWLFYKIRVYETHGRFNFCTAGVERLAEDLGITEEQVRWGLAELCRLKVLFHICCDKKVYRNKTRIYVTKTWLEERGITKVAWYKVGVGNRKSRAELGRREVLEPLFNEEEPHVDEDELNEEITEVEVAENRTKKIKLQEKIEEPPKNGQQTSLDLPLLNSKIMDESIKNMDESRKIMDETRIGIGVDLNRNKLNRISKNNKLNIKSPIKAKVGAHEEDSVNEKFDKSSSNLENQISEQKSAKEQITIPLEGNSARKREKSCAKRERSQFDENIEVVQETIEDEGLKKAWLEFLAMRRENKYRPYKRMLDRIRLLAKQTGGDVRFQIAALKEATMEEWQGWHIDANDWRKKEKTLSYLEDYQVGEACPWQQASDREGALR